MTEHAWNMRRANMRQNGFGTEVMKGIKVCSACGTVMPVKKHRCPECGTRMPIISLFQVYRSRHRCCAKCGLVVADSAQYCPDCGSAIPKSQKNDF